MPSRQINDFFTKMKQKKTELVARPVLYFPAIFLGVPINAGIDVGFNSVNASPVRHD